MNKKFLDIISKFDTRKILVIGDVMLDRYIYGKVERISPEAPIPIVKVYDEKYVAGGAGNTAVNLACLGAEVNLIGVVGEDGEAEILKKILKENGINYCFFSDKRPTIQKIRIVGERQQIVRVDYEDSNQIDEILERKIKGKIKELVKEVNAVIISDYAKGCITKQIATFTIRYANKCNKKVIVDPKPVNKEFYEKAFIVTPNNKESFEMTNEEDIKKRGEKLQKELGAKVLITLGERGMVLFDNGRIKKFKAIAKEVYDVSGAGDTVVATLALAISSGASLDDAVELANYAAGIVVTKSGTTPIKKEELLTGLKVGVERENKIKNKEEIKEIVEYARKTGKKIVTTNGVFDLLHYGHVSILKKAKKLGDILILGINTDESVKRLKGKNRPILGERERASIVASLDCVDYVCFFSEDTPEKLIECIRPDIHVKGDDRKLEEIYERKIVEKYGGKVVLLPRIRGISTTNIINKILKANKD